MLSWTHTVGIRRRWVWEGGAWDQPKERPPLPRSSQSPHCKRRDQKNQKSDDHVTSLHVSVASQCPQDEGQSSQQCTRPFMIWPLPPSPLSSLGIYPSGATHPPRQMKTSVFKSRLYRPPHEYPKCSPADLRRATLPRTHPPPPCLALSIPQGSHWLSLSHRLVPSL